MSETDPSTSQNSANESTWNRREYLGAVGGSVAGISALASLQGVAKGAGGSSDRVTIPIIKKGDTVVKEKEVPRKWFNHVQNARQAKQATVNQYKSHPGVVSVSRVRSKHRYGGRDGFNIQVGVRPDRARPELPDQVNDIPVKVVEESRFTPTACEVTDKVTPVPGGVEINPDQGGFGTTGIKVEQGGSYFMLTAAHLWDNQCSESIRGEACDIEDGSYFGSVDEFDREADYALVTPVGYNADDYIREDDGFAIAQYPVGGYYTSSGVDTLITDGKSARSMGIVSGETSGTVEENGTWQGWDCVNFEYYGVGIDVHTIDGDSGGPVYRIEGDYAIMVTINQYGDATGTWSGTCNGASSLDDNTFARGTGFYHLHDSYNINTV